MKLLSETIAEQERSGERPFQANLYQRLIAHLLVEERREEALRVFDQATERHSLPGITREQIERGSASLAAATSAAGLGVIEFRLPASAAGKWLWVSAHGQGPPDAEYERIALGTSRSELQREAADPTSHFISLRVERKTTSRSETGHGEPTRL